MNNDTILASISKIHAYRYAKEKQKGALTTNGGFSTKDPALLQVPCTIQCVFIPKNVISTQQTPFTTSSRAGIRVDLTNGLMIIYLGSTSIIYNQTYEIGIIYNIVFSVSTNQVNLYVNGELKKTLDIDTSQLVLYRIGSLLDNKYYFEGDYLLHRHFNYAMSADEVKTLDNNGDPLGYVVPKAIKSEGKCIAEYVASNLIGSSTDKTIAITWLDSAKQLPWSDAYLPPLLQSKGGYDMVANGAPEVLFKDTTIKAGVKLGYNESPTASTTKKFTTPPISIGTSDFSIEYYGNAYGTGSIYSQLLSNSNTLGVGVGYFNVYGINIGKNGLNWVTFKTPEGGNITTDSLSFNYLAPTLDEKFHVIITRYGKTIKVYINNTLIKSKEQTEIKDLGEFVLALANSSDVSFVRVYNYALSQEEVTTLYNGGKPDSYILPSKYKGTLINTEFTYNSIQTNTTDTTINELEDYTEIIYNSAGANDAYPRFVSKIDTNYKGYIEIELDAECSDIEGFIVSAIINLSTSNTNSKTTISNRNKYRFFGLANSTGFNLGTLFQGFGDPSNVGKTLKLYSYKIIYKGCIAEHLAQNLVADPSNTNFATGWLDSAKQLPVNDSSLPPLEESLGEYDMTASNKPQIIYKSI